MTWWRVGVPLATILIVAIASGFHASNFTAAAVLVVVLSLLAFW